MPLFFDALEMCAQTGGYRLVLIVADGKQSERADQFPHMLGSGRDHHERAVAGEHAFEFRAISRRKNAQQQRRGSVGDGQTAPNVAKRRTRTRVGTGGPPQCCFGNVQRQSRAAGQGIEDRAKVVAGSGSGLDNQTLCAALASGGGNGSGDEMVMPRFQKSGSRGDHLRRVSRMCRRRAAEVRVALLRDIETVALGAAQRPPGTGFGLGEAAMAKRALQAGYDRRVHRRNSSPLMLAQ